MLTAVLLTPANFPSVLGDDYPEACTALGLAPLATGYGLVLGQDGDGARWTVVIDDVSLVAVVVAAWGCGMAYDLSPDAWTVVAALPGWPLAVTVTAPGAAIPPHDPEPTPEGEDWKPLAPPQSDTWGPAQRRLGTDGPGWSMVAGPTTRTDEIAFVLLDEEPGDVLPVAPGPELPALLEALDKMAVRPA
ncbi:hypothetical protein ABZ791_32435 [Streptomyces huasconensis]|uniref:Uncharacterized protein n=1 Tax=Streptomyces huasconensis TaxID=1854574 RepID=A0ABV3M083_9ACTN